MVIVAFVNDDVGVSVADLLVFIFSRLWMYAIFI